jgi:hypothetical protein
MAQERPEFTRCLLHQLPEDQMSFVGLVCPCCKRRLYTDPPRGRCLSFWESQPAASSAEGDPCFVYTLMWDDFRIRSLHPALSEEDPRGRRIREAAGFAEANVHPSATDWPGFNRMRRPFSDSEFRNDADLGLDPFGFEEAE